MIRLFKRFLQKKMAWQSEKRPAVAYNSWSASYDAQPGNLVLELDEQLFGTLLDDVILSGKNVADIGCGTGRHWQKIYEKKPAFVTGYDVSAGMLSELLKKFPAAITHHIKDAILQTAGRPSIDCIISTLTIAHIKDIGQTIVSWCKALSENGDILITDLHPAILENGGRRSFQVNGRSFSVKNHVHSVEKLIAVFAANGLELVRREERYINEDVKKWYEQQSALQVYDRFKGLPVIYGLHLKRRHAAK